MAGEPQVGPRADQWMTHGPEADHGSGAVSVDLNGRPQVLILEDDLNCGTIVSEIVRAEGADCMLAGSVNEARDIALQNDFDFYILDYKLPDGTGASFYYFLLEHKEVVNAIMLTGLPEVSQAVALTKTGLMDYLTKPFSLVQLRSCLQQAFARRTRRGPAREMALTSLSPAMQRVLRQARQAGANTLSTVLLTGETGVGKDVLARAIHCLSNDSEANFVSLNCATLPGEMFEAELFGAERGAYTGATQQRQGVVEHAESGTLFLDEIAEVPFHLQAKLLHLLENREFRRLGSPVHRKFSGRIIAATNQCLRTAVAEGRFRADLLYRLDVFSMVIPPLRDRKEDLPGLCDEILKQLAERYSRARPAMRNEDLNLLRSHSFPGNIRELRNILERALLGTPPDCAWLQLTPECRQKLQIIHLVTPPAVVVPPGREDMTPVEAQEYQLVKQALLQEKGAIRRAAAKLDMSHQALLRRLQKWPELRESTLAKK